MADIYSNPFAGLPETNLPNNPFWSGVNQGERSRTMAPFVDMERQRQSLGLQKQQQETQEFMSPQAKNARMLGFDKIAAQAGFDIAKAKADLETLPLETQKKVAKTRQELIDIQGQPAAKFFQAAGLLGPYLEKQPEGKREGAWRAFTQRFAMEGIPTPAGFESYSPKVLESIKGIGYASVMTPGHLQQLEVKDKENAGKMAVQKEHSRSSLETTKITAGATVQAARERANIEKPLNEGQERVRLRRIINDPEASQEEKEIAKENMRSQAAVMINKRVEAEQVLIMRGATTRDKIKQEVYEDLGLTPETPKPRDNRTQAITLFGAYEPDKYEYGINPATGKFARKLKNK